MIFSLKQTYPFSHQQHQSYKTGQMEHDELFLHWYQKCVGPRMQPWWTPALIGYSWKNFPSRTTWSCILPRKDERQNTWPEISNELGLWRRPVSQTLLKALDILSASAPVVPDLLKALAILLDTNFRGSAVDQENLKPYWKSDKRPDFLRWSASLFFTSFLKN